MSDTDVTEEVDYEEPEQHDVLPTHNPFEEVFTRDAARKAAEAAAAKESATSPVLAQRTPDVARTTEELRAIQVRARAEGHCGSLQTASGLPCMRYPRAGYTVCRKHGERSPATVAKAERLLAVARMPAIEWILTAVDQANETTCETCGFPRHGLKERKRIDSLTFKLLDRTGFGPRQTIDLHAKTQDSGVDVSNFNAEELAQLDLVLRAMDDLQQAVQTRCAREAAEKVIEGVVVKAKALTE